MKRSYFRLGYMLIPLGIALIGFQNFTYLGSELGNLRSQTIYNSYVFTRSSGRPDVAYYDYAPSVLFDGNQYHIYWCGGMLGSPVNGDYILHAVSNSPTGPFHSSTSQTPLSFDISLKGTGDPASFDGAHTCDPSVIKIGSTYYMYYGGLGTNASAKTAIGVAVSSDGTNFRRAYGGHPIVTAANTNPRPPSNYGAGQPSVLYLAPYFYMTFSDTTGAGVNPINGAGQFILRSPDPLFTTNLEELTSVGWASRAPGVHTSEYKFIESTSVDWFKDDLTGKVFVVSNQALTATWIYAVDPGNSFATIGKMSLPGTWRDGPAVLRQADGAALPRAECSQMKFSIFKGDSTDTNFNNVNSWDLSLSEGIFELHSSLCPSDSKELAAALSVINTFLLDDQ